MKSTSAPRRFSAAKWALLTAAIGFTYALMTSVSPSASANATTMASRALTTNGTRLPTEFVTGPNLGAAVVGSGFTRQILVRFGFRPHKFTFSQFVVGNGSLSSTGDGKVQGNVLAAGVGAFQANVFDSQVGTPPPPVSRVFNIIGVDQQFAEAPLHYEVGNPVAFGTVSQTIQLTTAVAGDVYFYSLAPNGGTPPYKYTLQAPHGVRFLPQGLAFDAEKGLIYGKPILPTPVGSPANINILLTDSLGASVLGNFLLDVVPGTITSQAVATAGSMTVNFGNVNLNDSLALTLILDKSELNAAGIRTPADLEGLPISMNFAGFSLPPKAQPKSRTTIINTFDKNGAINVPVTKLVVGDPVGPGVKDVIYTIKLNPATGVLTARFQNINMGKTIGANFTSFEGFEDATNRGPILPINVRIGLGANSNLEGSSDGVLDKTDIVKFVYKRSGSIGHGTAKFNDNLAPAGIFLINKVLGTEAQVVIDTTNNIKEDRLFFQLRGLMRQPGSAPVVPVTGDVVSVFINRLNIGTFPASSFAAVGQKLVFSNDDPSKGLKDLIIDNAAGTVFISTHGVAASTDLFGQDILFADDPQTIPITLQISGPDLRSATFDGQSTVTVFRKGKVLVNK
ncbi:MAG: putative Ig domain-containing protein [Planctomycetota bacterium]